MEFDIDVSGQDIFEKDYTVTIANKDSIIYSYKFDKTIISNLVKNYERGLYRYLKSRKQRSLFKVRVYCVVIYHLFIRIKKAEKIDKSISLNICKDFDGHENNINSNLRVFLQEFQDFKIESINHIKLGKDSNAHHYAYLIRKDKKNKFPNIIRLKLSDFEKYLKK